MLNTPTERRGARRPRTDDWLLIHAPIGNDVAAGVTTARIVMRPVNHAAKRIVLVFASHRHVFAEAQWNGTGEIDVGFDPYRQVAPIAHFEKEAFVRAAWPHTRTEDARNFSTGDGFLA